MLPILWYLARDDAGGGGKKTVGKGKEDLRKVDLEEDDDLQDDAEDTQDGDGDGGHDDSGDEPRYTQADLDKLIGKTRQQERDKHERLRKKEKEDADRKADEEKGEFKRLYETEKAARESEKPLIERAERLSQRMNEIIDGEIKDWPAELKEMDPGPDDVEVRANWAEKSRALAKKLAAATKAPDPEHGKSSEKPSKTTGKLTRDYYAIPGRDRK